MACSYPITIKDKTRGTDVLPVFLLVPCGKCIPCIQRKRADWSFRLLQELKASTQAHFLTLTYNENYLPQDYKLDKTTIQKYFKRVRTNSPQLKYYAVGEYGTINKRPHYHAIVYNTDKAQLIDKWTDPETQSKEPLGFAKIGAVTEASIHYVTGYITEKYGKIDDKTGKALDTWTTDDIRPFSLMSKGLGKQYLKHNTKFHKSNFTIQTKKEGGQNVIIPRYFKDKIFNSEKDKTLEQMGFVQFTEKELLSWRNQIIQFYQNVDINTGEITVNASDIFNQREYEKLIVQKQLKKKSL